MCGIVGIVDLTFRRPIDRAALARMNDSLVHRGPDGDGFHFEPGVGLGHRRLSIIDLEGGKQPLYNEDGSVVVTFNGEIYNFQELVRELAALGHTFRTRCDSEVIVHGWEEWGESCVERFNGMFAFAVWDRRREVLFLARDRLGVKPLFYTLMADGTALFASELKALLQYRDLAVRVDPTAIEDYFTFGYIPDPKTIYRDVLKLAPGHRLTLRRGSRDPAPVRYWDVALHEPPDNTDFATAKATLIDRLKGAVERRLVADVPLGAFLSGGIDSSAVVAMMKEADRGAILTCSIGFRDGKYDESNYANLVATHKKTDHKLEFVDAYDFSLIDRLASLYDEPYADSSAIPTYRVCQLARKHVTVALSGDGGDEDFLGYRRYKLFAMEERLRSLLPPRVRRAVFEPLGRHYPKLDWAPRILRGKSTFQALARDSADAYLHSVSICTEDVRRRLFSDELKEALAGYRSNEVFAGHISGKSFADPLRMVQYLDYHTYLPGDILTKVDRASMAHGLEVRAPFLDYTFVDWAARLPTPMKLHGLEGKYLLKRSLAPHLPREILDRRKMGFAVPIDAWFRGSLRERVKRVLETGALFESGYFSQATVSRLLREHQSRLRDHSASIWALLMFERFLGSSGTA